MDHVTPEQIDALLHRRLPDPERRAVAQHLAECAICAARAANDRDLNAAAAALRDDVASTEHPEIEDLFAYADGALPPHHAEAIAAHLRDCARCSEDVEDARAERAKLRRPPTRNWMPVAAAVTIVAVASAVLLLHRAPAPGPPNLPSATTAPPHPRSPYDAIVDQARRSGAIAMPDVLRDLRGGPGALRGTANAAGDADMHPAGVVVASDRPELTWRASAADRAIVTIVCNNTIAAVSGTVRGGRWTPDHPLPRGSRCVWQIERLPDRAILPAPPAAQPAFRVLDAQSLAEIERADGDDFLAGVLYARAGAPAEAVQRLARYAQSHPNDAAALSVLESVRRW